MDEPIDFQDGFPFQAGLPVEALTLYRLLVVGHADRDSFRPDCVGRKKYGFEDHATYRGFSAFMSLETARDAAEEFNLTREIPFTFLVPFRIKPKKGHAVARTEIIPGHVSVWAAARDIPSTLRDLVPITGQQG